MHGVQRTSATSSKLPTHWAFLLLPSPLQELVLDRGEDAAMLAGIAALKPSPAVPILVDHSHLEGLDHLSGWRATKRVFDVYQSMCQRLDTLPGGRQYITRECADAAECNAGLPTNRLVAHQCRATRDMGACLQIGLCAPALEKG